MDPDGPIEDLTPLLFDDFNSRQGEAWASAERDDMVDDIEELEITVSGLTAALFHAKKDADRWEARHRAVKAQIDERVRAGSQKLWTKLSIYTDIIQEYDQILKQSHKLHTERLKKLLKEGGIY